LRRGELIRHALSRTHLSLARYTCAIEPLATGSSEKVSKIVWRGAPKASSITVTVSESRWAGASWRRELHDVQPSETMMVMMDTHPPERRGGAEQRSFPLASKLESTHLSVAITSGG
jgi:hypothetical protein